MILAATDWTGLATFVAALCTGIVSIIAALTATGAHRGVKQVQRDIRLPSDPDRPIGAAVDDGRQIQTALVNEYRDLRRHNPMLDRRDPTPATPDTTTTTTTDPTTTTTTTVNGPLTPEGGTQK